MKRLLFFLFIMLSPPASAESGAYRIEVIVFRQLDVATEAVAAEELRGFSRFPDLRETRPPEILPGTTEDQSVEATAEVIPTRLPDDVHIITQRSMQMDGVWRRLRSSQGYQPLVYAAWEQNRTDYYPPMRIRNGQVIDTRLRPPTNIVVADLAAEDPLAAYRSTFYQLDGSVQLRRSRFLHLFLDLEYRVEIPEPPAQPGFFGGGDMQPGVGGGIDINLQHGTLKLKENRQIRTGRLQYFDTPFFGALVLVSAINPGNP